MHDELTVLGFDFGTKKIGVAVGQTLTRSANPLAVIRAQDGVPNWETIEELIQTWQVDACVVGIPLNMDGSEQPITESARKFANRLHGRFHLPVHLMDERLTTDAAKREMKRLDKDEHNLDSYAAKIILEAWLSEWTQQPPK